MNKKNIGVQATGIKLPIMRQGDDLINAVVDNVLKATEIDWSELEMEDADMCDFNLPKYGIHNKDVIGITESVVARTKGEYIEVDMIAANVIEKFGKDATICLVNPIYSRNRFAMILKGIARAAKKVIIVMPDYDEVGNPRGTNPFTGVNIEEYYKELCESENCECIISDSLTILSSSQNEWDNWGLIYCALHINQKDFERWALCLRSKNCPLFEIDEIYRNKLMSKAYTLADICSDKSPDWGVLGTNKATEERLKLFPSKAECQRVCEAVKAKIKEKTGKDVIVCVYGDGCFKDPVGGIWEFADPVTMPGYTDKELIESTPNEYKLKYLIDTGLPEEQIMAFTNNVSAVDYTPNRMGTTPRLYRDLLASLMDLTSGSGDRATPVVLIQNYF